MSNKLLPDVANDLLKTEQINPGISLDGIHPDLINGLLEAKRNSSEIPNSSKELMEFVKFCRNASATEIRQIHDRARDLIVNYKECCNKSCKEEDATLEPLVPKWQENDALAWIIVEFSQYNFLCFEFRKLPKILSFSAENKVDYKFHQEEIGTFNTLEEAKAKVNKCIKELGERLVYFANNIKTDK